MNQPLVAGPSGPWGLGNPIRVRRTPVGTDVALVSAKLSIPLLPAVTYVRRRLIDRLTAARQNRLTVVTGPAGSGKTTLASTWIRAEGTPAAWLTLDGGDNAPSAFWRYLLHGIRGCRPDLRQHVPDPRSTTIDQAMLTRLAIALEAQASPVTVVLDRAESITNPAIATGLDLLLRHAGPGLRMIVLGRHSRLVPLYRYQLAGQVTEIDGDDLALTRNETTRLVASQGAALSAQEVGKLHDCTEGWLTAVCLHVLALRAGDRPRFPHPAGVRAVTEFLRTEILDTAPPHVRDLLLRSSIVDELHPDLGDRLTGRNDAHALLDELARTNSFVRGLPDGQFRYHPSLRQALHHELAVRCPDLVGRLHRQTARWYAERHRYADALHHCVTIGAWDQAADMAVNRLGVASLLTAPEAAVYRSALVGLPDDERAPAAQVLRPSLALTAFDLPAARVAVDTAAATLRGTTGRPDSLPHALRGAQVVLSRLTGDADAAARIAAEVDGLWAQMPPWEIADEARLRALIWSNAGVAALWAGRFAAAWTALTKAASAADRGTEYMVHDALAHLALILLVEGRLRQADEHARESLKVADRAGLPSTARVGAASVTLAATAWLRNDAHVHSHLSRAMVAMSARLDPPTAIVIAMMKARIATARLDGRHALAAVQVARANLSGWHPSTLASDFTESTAVRAHLLLGDTASARRCVESMSEGMDRQLALGMLETAQGKSQNARRSLAAVLDGDARPDTRQDAALCLAKLAFVDGDVPAAIRTLGEALEYGRTEQSRRPFLEAGAWVRQLLDQTPELAAERNWLFGPPGSVKRVGSDGDLIEALTRRESEVLVHLARALSTEDIADSLYLSVNTVKTHLKSIYRKLGISDRSAAARRARELKLLPG